MVFAMILVTQIKRTAIDGTTCLVRFPLLACLADVDTKESTAVGVRWRGPLWESSPFCQEIPWNGMMFAEFRGVSRRAASTTRMSTSHAERQCCAAYEVTMKEQPMATNDPFQKPGWVWSPSGLVLLAFLTSRPDAQCPAR
jgi:hypothetical protein